MLWVGVLEGVCWSRGKNKNLAVEVVGSCPSPTKQFQYSKNLKSNNKKNTRTRQCER